MNRDLLLQVVESLVNDKIDLTEEEWTNLVENDLDPGADGKWLQCMTAVPRLVRRSQHALSSATSSNRCDSVNMMILGTDVLRQECKTAIAAARSRFDGFDESRVSAGFISHYHATYMRSLAMALSTGVLLNCVRRRLANDSPLVQEELSRWSVEILALAEAALQYRPLGSASMAMCLCIAWTGATDPVVAAKVMNALIEYDRVCLGTVSQIWKDVLVDLEKRFGLEGTATIDTPELVRPCGLTSPC